MKSKGYVRDLFNKETSLECNINKEDYIDWMEEKLTSHSSDYAKCADEIGKYFMDNLGMTTSEDVVKILRAHFA
jgi:hypothetical protein